MKYRLLLIVFGFMCVLTVTCDGQGTQPDILDEIVPVESAIYHVSTGGNDANDGLSTGTAWRTIAHAAGQAQAGDTVLIRAGSYVGENVVIAHSGTASAPIMFEGRDAGWNIVEEPGYLDLHLPGGVDPPPIDASRMPLLNGGHGVGDGISISGESYIELANLQITGYSIGVYGLGIEEVTLNNLLITNCSSRGIMLQDGDYCKVINSAVTDCEMDDIALIGPRNSLIENCQAHDMPGGISTDYFIIITGDSRDAYANTIRHCYAELDGLGVDGHSGHGIGLKGSDFDVYDTLVEDCVSWTSNKCFYVRHSGVYDNVFRNCTVYDAGNELASCNGFVARDGAHDNRFINCRVVGTGGNITYGVAFYDTTEDGDNAASARDNVFENCIFQDCDGAIMFLSGTHDSPARDNLFINCVFANDDEGVLARRDSSDNTGNIVRNSIVTGYALLESGNGTGEIEFAYSVFHNNRFEHPAGGGNILEDPLFLDSMSGLYRLQSGSPAIDAGSSIAAPSTDFEGNPRPQGTGYDIGAYEYSGDGRPGIHPTLLFSTGNTTLLRGPEYLP